MSADFSRPPQSGGDSPRRQRREPGWGRLDGLDFQSAAQRARKLMPERRWLPWIALGIVVASLTCLLLLRRPLADWLWPEARVQELREQAAMALAHGRLSAADGSGARELYEAALAIDPDRVEARAGLARVAQAALARGEAALARDDFGQAHRLLALARELDAPRAPALALAGRLRDREADVAGVGQLLARADAARAAGRLQGAPDAALPLYARVLSLRPQNIRALEGREDALSDLLQQAETALRGGDIARAAALVADARDYDAGHVDLPQAQDDLTHAIDGLRQRARRELQRGRLDAAAAGFKQLQALDAADESAKRGLAAIVQAHASSAEHAAADFDFASAEKALQQARALQPDGPAIAQAEKRIALARDARARLPGAGASRPGRNAQARVAALLRASAAAEARGDLLTPPGESAYDKLRAASAIAPDDPAVRRAQARLAPAARRCFERELPRNDLGRARACLDSWEALEGGGTAIRRARQRLGQRWIAVGNERLGAGQVTSARSALRAATSVDPETPGLEDFRRRLRIASGNND